MNDANMLILTMLTRESPICNFGSVLLMKVGKKLRANSENNRGKTTMKKIAVLLMFLLRIVSTFLFFYISAPIDREVFLSCSIFSFPFLLAFSFATPNIAILLLIVLLLSILPLLWFVFILLFFMKKKTQQIGSIGLVALLIIDVVFCSISAFTYPSVPKFFNIFFSGVMILLIASGTRGRFSCQKKTGDGLREPF